MVVQSARSGVRRVRRGPGDDIPGCCADRRAPVGTLVEFIECHPSRWRYGADRRTSPHRRHRAPTGPLHSTTFRPGTYHLSVIAQGFSTRRTEVQVAAGHDADRAPGRLRSALRGSRVGERRCSQSVRYVPGHIRSRGSGTVQATRDVARRDARESAWRCGTKLWPCSGASRHSRARRRSSPDPSGRSAPRRSLESVGRSRRADQPGGGAEDRGRSRSGDVALRRECDRRTRQRHHRRDPDEAA